VCCTSAKGSCARIQHSLDRGIGGRIQTGVRRSVREVVRQLEVQFLTSRVGVVPIMHERVSRLSIGQNILDEEIPCKSGILR
jgi:hypothetical protein